VLAVRIHAPGGKLALEEVPLPEPSGNEVRVRVAGCGVCHTDVHIARGEMTRVSSPLILGHEVSGWVDAWGPDAAPAIERNALKEGDPVLVFGGWGCGECADCRSGEEQRCATGRSPGFQVDGGYAETMLVPDARYLVPLGALDPVHAAPLADAGLTPFRAVRRAAPWLQPGARALIIGFGGLGQFALQYLRRRDGLQVVVCDTDPDKRAQALAAGADAAADPARGEPLAGALEDAAGAVFDFVGTDATLQLGASLLAPGGLLMVIGEGGGTLGFRFDATALETWLTTSVWGSLSELREVAALAGSGKLTWDVELVPLGDAAKAHDRLAAGQVRGRIVLVPAVN